MKSYTFSLFLPHFTHLLVVLSHKRTTLRGGFFIGSTEEEITDIYGELYGVCLNINGNVYKAVYMIRDNTPELLMGYDNLLWYDIYFINEIATKAELRKGHPGG